MSWTKKQIITQAFSEIGLASYVYDLTATELEDAVRILDSMMGEWTVSGIVFSPTVYPNPVNVGDGDIADETNAPPEAVAPMYYNLAVRLAPSFGKTVSPNTMRQASAGYSLLAQGITVPEIQLTGMIRGAGAKTPIVPFIGGNTTS